MQVRSETTNNSADDRKGNPLYKINTGERERCKRVTAFDVWEPFIHNTGPCSQLPCLIVIKDIAEAFVMAPFTDPAR